MKFLEFELRNPDGKVHEKFSTPHQLAQMILSPNWEIHGSTENGSIPLSHGEIRVLAREYDLSKFQNETKKLKWDKVQDIEYYNVSICFGCFNLKVYQEGDGSWTYALHLRSGQFSEGGYKSKEQAQAAVILALRNIALTTLTETDQE